MSCHRVKIRMKWKISPSSQTRLKSQLCKMKTSGNFHNSLTFTNHVSYYLINKIQNRNRTYLLYLQVKYKSVYSIAHLNTTLTHLSSVQGLRISFPIIIHRSKQTIHVACTLRHVHPPKSISYWYNRVKSIIKRHLAANSWH